MAIRARVLTSGGFRQNDLCRGMLKLYYVPFVLKIDDERLRCFPHCIYAGFDPALR